MARLTLKEGEDFAQSRKGISVFDASQDSKWQMIFLGDTSLNEIMYINPVHDGVMTEKGKGRFRCLEGHYEYEKDHEGKVVNDTNGQPKLARDPANGQLLNDGSCPLCTNHYAYMRMISAEWEQWKEANPSANDKEIKEKFKELAQANPSSKPALMRAFLCAVVECDKHTGKPIRNVDQTLRYTIQPVKFTENMYEKKLKEAISMTLRDLTDEEIKAGDNGLVWHEFQFSYPASNLAPNLAKADTVKNMTISAVMGANSQILKNDPEFRAQLEAAVAEMDLDAIEAKMNFFRPVSLGKLHKFTAGRFSVIRADMTDEEKLEAAKKLSVEHTNLSSEQAADIFNAGTQVAAGTETPTTAPTPVTGAPATASADMNVDDLVS